jgi:4-carboxymuconolactone decarboxylase
MRLQQDRYEKGRRKLEEMAGTEGVRMMDKLAEVAPDLARYTIEYAFGDVYSRPGLDLRTRMLATVAGLTALGNAQPQLRANIQNALKVGCTREEILEVILQMSVYAGFPAALNGVFAATEAFETA